MTTDDRDPRTAAVREYAIRAVETAALLDPAHESWAGATRVVLHDPFLRDLLVVHIILNGTCREAATVFETFPNDQEGNRDMVLAAAYWLTGDADRAHMVGTCSVNRSAQLVGVLAATGIPAQPWADALVANILHR